MGRPPVEPRTRVPGRGTLGSFVALTAGRVLDERVYRYKKCSMGPRIAPLTPPYAPDTQASLDKWMPPGAAVEPLALFRTVARHAALSDRMRALGGHFLGSRARLPVRVRELVILRTCARCSAEYEWGVHAVAFGAAAGLDEAALRATVDPGASPPPPEDACVFQAVD